MIKNILNLLIALIFIFCPQAPSSHKDEKIPAFALREYQEMIDLYPSDIVLGHVTDADDAKALAEIIWAEKYGDKVANKKPYEVLFDEENQVWLVQGTLPDGWWGGVGYILIEKQAGKVLAIWHTM